MTEVKFNFITQEINEEIISKLNLHPFFTLAIFFGKSAKLQFFGNSSTITTKILHSFPFTEHLQKSNTRSNQLLEGFFEIF